MQVRHQSLVQMVIDLFVQSGKAPPEDHDVPKPPPILLYNPWQAVKLKPLQPQLNVCVGRQVTRNERLQLHSMLSPSQFLRSVLSDEVDCAL